MENMLKNYREIKKNKLSQTFKQVVVSPADRGLTLFRLKYWISKYYICYARHIS